MRLPRAPDKYDVSDQNRLRAALEQADARALKSGQAVAQLQFDMKGLSNCANDTAAAAAGVPVGGAYRNGSVLMVRVT